MDAIAAKHQAVIASPTPRLPRRTAGIGLLHSVMYIVRDITFWVLFSAVRRSCLALEINPLLVTGSRVEALDVLVNWQA
ncbi:MAG: hypothetical protein ACLQUY_25550 [Ktedonobacterales bacterium]